MKRAVRKLNFLIEEGICKDLEDLIPSGKRSMVANNALRKELELIRRKKAADKLLAVASRGRRFSNSEILAELTKERSGH